MLMGVDFSGLNVVLGSNVGGCGVVCWSEVRFSIEESML